MNPGHHQVHDRAGMPDATIHVQGADGVHFEAVVSASFAGKRRWPVTAWCMPPWATSWVARSMRCQLRTLTPRRNGQRA
jgi:hypothetical protein